MSKGLITYYSRSGKNYVSGDIKELQTGNTEVIAKRISGLTGFDLFKIDTKEPYPEDYHKTVERARKECNEDSRPELVNTPDFSAYDIICIGYPNWCGTMPMVMFTLLESGNLSGKTIAPFCTHEGSGLGGSTYDIQRICPQSRVTEGLEIKGSDVDSSAAVKKTEEWVKKNIL